VNIADVLLVEEFGLPPDCCMVKPVVFDGYVRIAREIASLLKLGPTGRPEGTSPCFRPPGCNFPAPSAFGRRAAFSGHLDRQETRR